MIIRNDQVRPGMLALEDGRIFRGISVGHEGIAFGEVVFNTSMTGYQEILTDPSYAGQIVAMTAPHIGNTGINEEDHESERPRLRGFLMREISPKPSNWRSTKSLDDFLKRHKIVAISGVDTRSLTRHIRSTGAMRAVIASGEHSEQMLVEKAKNSPRLEECDHVCEVSTPKPFNWNESCVWVRPKEKYVRKIVVYDFGVKRNILRILVSYGAAVHVVPSTMTADEILQTKPDGVLLSNGPGDPAGLDYIVRETRKLFGKVPVFGICLGHQLIARALGAETYKLKFGHRGVNQPVINRGSGMVEITSQNHGFCVDERTLLSDVEISHCNLNDGTVEGIRHKILPILSVQYHPEANAGPHDSVSLFESFLRQ